MMTGRGEGYVIDDGEFTSFVVPGSTSTVSEVFLVEWGGRGIDLS